MTQSKSLKRCWGGGVKTGYGKDAHTCGTQTKDANGTDGKRTVGQWMTTQKRRKMCGRHKKDGLLIKKNGIETESQI
jgi:hypothetical protein